MSDHLIQGLGLGGRVRVIAAETTETAEEIRRIHQPSRTTTAALGRIATGALMLAAGLEKVTKLEPVITLEFNGGGPAGRLIATASPSGWLRAFVSNPEADAPRLEEGKLNVAGVVGLEGHLIVTRDPGKGQPYQGIVPIFTGEIGDDLALYLNESEQTPSGVLLGVLVGPGERVRHSGGILVQVLPGVTDAEANNLTDRLLGLGHLTERLDQGEGPQQWIDALFDGQFEQHQRTEVRFLCGCSKDRVERALKLLGESEIKAILDDEVDVTTLTCEFCKTDYPVSDVELQRLLAEVRSEMTPQ